MRAILTPAPWPLVKARQERMHEINESPSSHIKMNVEPSEVQEGSGSSHDTRLFSPPPKSQVFAAANDGCKPEINLKAVAARMHCIRNKTFVVEDDSSSETQFDDHQDEGTDRASRRKRAAAKIATERPGAVEICCGGARMAAQLRAVGFNALGVDWKFNKDKPSVRTLWLDLKSKQGRAEVRKEIKHLNTRHVHGGPPCGTASRAREIRISEDVDPAPLRSDKFPDGLPGLPKEAKAKVDAANEVYEFFADLMPELCEEGLSWILENPENSLFWKTRAMKRLWAWALRNGFEIKVLVFDMCMHGGERPKHVKFWYFNVDLDSLALRCD